MICRNQCLANISRRSMATVHIGCVQNCREIEIVERWKWVSEIVERWKQVSEIVEKYFPVKSSSQNLREIEFVENMRVSFRNCREIWKQVSEIVEKGGFFQFVESRIKLLIGWARRWLYFRIECVCP